MPAHTHKGDKRGGSASYTVHADGRKVYLTTGKTRRQTREQRKAGRSNFPSGKANRAGWRKARKGYQQFKRNF